MELPEVGELLTRLLAKVDRDKLQNDLAMVEEKMQQGGNWEDYTAVQQMQQEFKHLSTTVQELNEVEQQHKHLQELVPLLAEDTSGSLSKEFADDLAGLAARIQELLVKAEFTEPYDRYDAIIIIHVGQGGTDAQDWVEMLSRMYTKYAQKHSWHIQTVDQQFGAEAGLTEITLEINGLFAYGYLKAERGIHRLVRISPFNAGGTRETSFASVDVIPKVDQIPTDIVIDDSDLELKAFRASGPGGQHTNKSSTAVQLTHKPSGITVRCSTQRSQAQNREKALQILRAKLWVQAEEQRLEKQKALQGEKQTASWGQQTRNYVLHPYQLVKDLHTGKETSQVQAVLDGDLDLLRR